MGISALMFLALSVSMDNFAVCLGIGTANPVRRVRAPSPRDCVRRLPVRHAITRLARRIANYFSFARI
jgi:hypothetical protein